MTDVPNLTRTAEALREHDRLWSRWLKLVGNPDANGTQVASLSERIDAAAAECGRLFGFETSDRNNPEDCARLVRPGPPTPAPGAEVSFLRRMVAMSKAVQS